MYQIIETAPKMELTGKDLRERILPELANYHEIYHPLFQRREQREQSEKYLQGLLSEIENKSVEAMILHLEGDNPNAIRASQQFLGEGAWQDGPILTRHWQEVDKDIGDENGVLITDGSDFPKQGQESVGVKRQMCGQLGKVANCQAGVFLSYASHKGYTLLDRRLYLPLEWVEEESHADRRQQCGIPEDVAFQTKPQLAAEMIEAVHAAGSLRHRWLTCDTAFGRDTAFLDRVGKLLFYFAEVDVDTQVWLTRPVTAIPEWSGRGRKPTLSKLVDGEPTPQTVTALAESIAADAWTRHTIKEGSKGPLVADFACLRVVAVRDSLPGPDVWLVFRLPVPSQKTFAQTCCSFRPFRSLVVVLANQLTIQGEKTHGKTTQIQRSAKSRDCYRCRRPWSPTQRAVQSRCRPHRWHRDRVFTPLAG